MSSIEKISERLELVRNTLGKGKTEFSSLLGIAPQTYSKYFIDSKERRNPELLVTKLLSIGINANWYLTGKGEMFLPDTDEGKTTDPKVEQANKHFMEAVRLMMEAIEEKKTGKTDPEDESGIDTAVFSRILDQAKNHYTAGPAPDLTEEQLEYLKRLQ